MGFKLNLNKEQKQFEVVQPGEYEVTVVNFEPKQVGDKNVISVDYEIRSDVDQPSKGQKIRFDDFFCTEKALWKIENASIAAGFSEEESEFEKYTDWAKSYLNKKLKVKVVHEAGRDGKMWPRVSGYYPSDSNGFDFEEDPKIVTPF